MNESIWSDLVNLPSYPELKGDILADVLIIGGGLCGILCGYFLKNSGVDCVICEGRKIASGTTQNTTAKITSQHGLVYSKLTKKSGLNNAKMYLKAHQNALRQYETMAKNIDCDLETVNSYIYSKDNRKKIEDELRALDKIGFSASFCDSIEIPIKISGAVCFENQMQFNPLKFISHISKDLKIYENTFIKKIVSNKAISKNGSIKAKKIIVATHFPFINKHGSYFLKLYQERSYVSAFSNVPALKGMYLDEAKDGLSFRSFGNTLLIGSGTHRTGKNTTNWKMAEEFARAHYSKANLISRWATQDCISLDDIAYIGRYSSRTPDMFVATGFNKWGMSSSMLSAMILKDMVMERRNEFEDLFSPQRSILKPQLVINSFESALNLITPTAKRCTHLGCALKWNKAEHTWDCPCHGSRFDKNGKILNNPSVKNLK